MSDPIADILATVPLLAGLDRKQRTRIAGDFNDFRTFVRSDAEVAWSLLEHVGMLLHRRS